MSSIRYVTDAGGKRTAVILSLEEYENLLEDLHVLAAAFETKDETSRPFNDVVAELVPLMRSMSDVQN